jgi:peptide/nickel transport system substrate-binding protein
VSIDLPMRRRTLLGTAAASLLPAPAIAQAGRISTLRFIPQSNLVSLDPIWTTATVTANHGYYVYDTLYAANGKMQPQPQMAAGHELSSDGRVWRIRLRDGLRFHDGTPVRAIDCIASLQRFALADEFGKLLGRVVDKWGMADDRTLEIRLTKPFPLLLDVLAKSDSRVPFIMPERLARTPPTTAISEVIGSGPYRFLPSEYNSGSRVVYAKFTDYVSRTEPPDWASGAKIAHYDRIEWNIIPDAATAASALRNREVDWWENPTSDLIPMLKSDPHIKTMIQNPAGNCAVMRLNNLQAPFNNEAVRRAVMMAVNQEDYMSAVYGTDDMSVWRTCFSLFPCNTPYESEDGAGLLKGKHDPDVVKKALNAAGYKGERVVILNPTDFPTIGPLGQVTYDALKKAGMNVELAESDWGTVIQRRTSREPVDKGGWSIFHTWGAATAWATPATSSTVRGLGKEGWFGWWENPKVEMMVAEWLEVPDDAARKRLAAAINKAALEGVGSIPLGQAFVRTMFRDNVNGMAEGSAPYPWGIKPA